MVTRARRPKESEYPDTKLFFFLPLTINRKEREAESTDKNKLEYFFLENYAFQRFPRSNLWYTKIYGAVTVERMTRRKWRYIIVRELFG